MVLYQCRIGAIAPAATKVISYMFLKFNFIAIDSKIMIFKFSPRRKLSMPERVDITLFVTLICLMLFFHSLITELSMAERGLNWVFEGYEDGTMKPLAELMYTLSSHNMSIMFIGDSLNVQFHYAFKAELKRENIGNLLLTY